MTRLVDTLRHWWRVLTLRDSPDYSRVEKYTSHYYK
ncbi:hypothetical protein SEA_EDEN_62 [Microbacterium phage Eden]|uniref:Uncharacterized protein n=1 Tax=Microbacterium phage Eden TaxID=2250289 RepID=A0A345KWF5_9CAUD|nr:hypothetical protein HOT71_gp62 [Microbacterium phage Eden]AXH47357.1 hypothetical protein SEA_EDEN_62 [Microbacterium phage Eden]